MLYIWALQPLSVFAIWRMSRSDLPACSVPCQSPEMSPFAWVSFAGAGVAAGGDGEVWALADVEETPTASKATHVNAGSTRNTNFPVMIFPCSKDPVLAGSRL